MSLPRRGRETSIAGRAHTSPSHRAALPAHPILDVKTAEAIARTSNQAARLAMLQLEQAGVVKRVNVGKRNRAWEAVGLFELLNAFERELGSPGGAKPSRPVPR